MRQLLTLMLAFVPFLGMTAQEIEMTQTQAKNYYKNTTAKKRVSVHDPSVVYDSKSGRYYIFGTMRGVAYSTDLQNWTSVSKGKETNLAGETFTVGVPWKNSSSTNAYSKDAFSTPAVTKVTKGGVEVDFPAFDAYAWSNASIANWDISGNLWAPDIIWNPTMQKWCQYFSVNGDGWHSSIVLLTSDNIEGPYEYQGPVVITAFNATPNFSYKKTDLELVLGTQSSLPSRYSGTWVSTSKASWPHAIDPAVFFDEDGELWMAYGSWSGGIWILKLNKATGLRDYDATYTVGTNSDPYFGKRIAGGYYVSGEGSYIRHIGNYYYLFVSYGFYSPNGGYEMRVFRSAKPDGTYTDASSRSAVYTGYAMNYGPKATDNRGEKIMGAYNEWGPMTGTAGECAQGHNSVITTEDGRTLLVYHTKFNDGHPDWGFHAVRVHQLFQNKNGWLVAAPFEYNGETVTDADIASKQLVDDIDIPGTYQILIHKYKMDYANMEEVTPVEITLTADGKVTGAYSGTWSLQEGTSYLTIRLGTVTYNGVLFDEQIDGRTIRTVSFSAMATSGVNVWGYKYRPDYALAWQLNNMGTMPVSNNGYITKNVDLYSITPADANVSLLWTSSLPTVVSEFGTYYPVGLEEDTKVALTARMEAGNYFWQQTYNVTARSEENSKAASATWQNDMLARYKFDDADLTNSLNTAEKAQLLRKSTTTLPQVETGEPLRNGGVVHTAFGANGKESYVAVPNPLKGRDLTNGATISFFVKRTDANLWDALFGMTGGTGRLYMTGNLYLGFNDGVTADAGNGIYNNWIDINHPTTVENTKLGVDRWHLVTITFARTVSSSTGGIIIYVDGSKQTDKYSSTYNGKATTTKQGFTSEGYSQIVDFLASCDELYLGNGSFWGSADARFDELIVYDRALSLTEVIALNQMTNRSETSQTTLGIDRLAGQHEPVMDSDAVYDLMGRKVTELKSGLYIKNGKKFIVK